MMISPECYYDLYLRGKTKEEIASEIKKLKRDISDLKKVLEDPLVYETAVIYPAPQTQLWYSLEYLDKAVKAYEDAGGIYVPAKGEQRAAAFNELIPQITKITYETGGFSQGLTIRTIQIHSDCVTVSADRRFSDAPGYEEQISMSKEEFLNQLRKIRIGEWKHHYEQQYICDGTQWRIVIEYIGNHKPAVYEGDNAFPFSFELFRDLAGEYDDAEK